MDELDFTLSIGSYTYRLIEKADNNNQFYIITNKMGVIIVKGKDIGVWLGDYKKLFPEDKFELYSEHNKGVLKYLSKVISKGNGYVALSIIKFALIGYN